MLKGRMVKAAQKSVVGRGPFGKVRFLGRDAEAAGPEGREDWH